jgi:hypothetical protein
MRVGYACEGWLDRALIHGLRDRWCAAASLVQGHVRGTSVRKCEVAHLCAEFASQGCNVALLLTDATLGAWRALRSELINAASEQLHLPAEHVLAGVTDCDIEVWYVADAEYFAGFFESVSAADLTANCKGIVNAAFGTVRWEQRSDLATDIVRRARLQTWIRNSDSFAAFYDDVRGLGNRLGCHVPNERDREV